MPAGVVQALGALRGAAVGLVAATPTLISNSAAATQQAVTAATPVVTQGAALTGKGAVAAKAELTSLCHTVAHAIGGAVAATAGKGTLGTALTHSANGASHAAQSAVNSVASTMGLG